MDKPKKLTLDYSKWRCGEDGDNALGTGKTKLLNEDGFMCCLGIWSLQLGAPEGDLLQKDDPSELKMLIPLFAEDGRLKFRGCRWTTHLSTECMSINDDKDTTPEEKIEQLGELLREEGIELEVINKP